MNKRQFKKHFRKLAITIHKNTFIFNDMGVHWFKNSLSMKIRAYEKQCGQDKYLIEIELSKLIFDYIALNAPKGVLCRGESLNLKYPNNNKILQEILEIYLDNKFYEQATKVLAILEKEQHQPYNYTLSEYQSFIEEKTWYPYCTGNADEFGCFEKLYEGDYQSVLQTLDAKKELSEEQDWIYLYALGLANNTKPYAKKLIEIFHKHSDIYTSFAFKYYRPMGHDTVKQINSIIHQNKDKLHASLKYE